jgi:hypothetical protein
MSRPLLRCLFGEYWFHLSRYVYDGNRSFAPILRQSQWSLLYDVYWLVTMMMVDQVQQRVLEQVALVTGNRQRDRNNWTQFRIRIFFWTTNKQRIDENENKINNWTMNKINERLITNKRAQINKSQITTNWHKHMHNIYKSRAPLLKEVEMWPSRYCSGLKHLCDYRTNNCNPIWPGIKSETIQATEGFCAYLKK